jgi:hypothetical protein
LIEAEESEEYDDCVDELQAWLGSIEGRIDDENIDINLI